MCSFLYHSKLPLPPSLFNGSAMFHVLNGPLFICQPPADGYVDCVHVSQAGRAALSILAPASSALAHSWALSGLSLTLLTSNSVFSGKTLIKVAEAEKRLGAAERDFIHTASINFLTPLRNFLEGDWKTISVRDLGPLCFPVTRAALSSAPRAKLSSHAGHRAHLGLPQTWLLWTERPGVDNLPGLGLSFPCLDQMAP